MPRVRINFRAFKDRILQLWLEEGNSQEEILHFLRSRYNLNVGLRTLQRQLQRWGFRKNESNIDLIEAEIRQLFEVGLSYASIIDYLSEERPEINISRRSLERKLKEWEMARYERLDYSPELVNIIRDYFYKEDCRDDLILTYLQHQHGIVIGRAFLIRIRMENGMRRRTNDPHQRLRDMMEVDRFINNYEQTSDAFGELGRDGVRRRIRRHAHIPITRSGSYNVYRQRYPEAVRQRRNNRPGNEERRGRRFTVPGPNYVWSMDGHMKLRFAGFEIYACIDAYSRKILWCNVSRSNSLPINVLNQYLLSIKTLGFRPWLTRTDHGVETPLMAMAHFQLAMHNKPTVIVRDADGINRERAQGHVFWDSHRWGTSRQNRKIEQWWEQLLRKVVRRWIAYFESLVNTDRFDRNSIPDQVALYAIYGDILRREIAEFVEDWNTHRIRYHPGMNHVVTGQVNEMWNNLGNTGVSDYGQSVRGDLELEELVEQLSAPLYGYDFDSFLAPETQRVCDEWLAEHPLGHIGDRRHPYIESYLGLKAHLEQHVANGREPRLAFNEFPRGGPRWYRDQLNIHREHMEAARREVQLRGREVDELADWFEENVLIV
ncbi:uncharacterized protein GGS22DRAFT_137816 [Annulohypoxylon maeteangense]|uniref:uncharacterized protein n=1 Tax=Annulohypoxylon maeteangense TaxID=1927788 RepID=UPI002008CC70|nr:uncharacterized protein GGS22DRAFT_137816 [Annulohypoxylon maeteangense]KAI0885049.1 hypothetical protein GGS22DRAFT_137816 [Annulohypoxylon maeteangense]